MKRLMYVMAVAMFMVPVLGFMSPVYAQFDGDVDLSGLLNGGGKDAAAIAETIVARRFRMAPSCSRRFRTR